MSSRPTRSVAFIAAILGAVLPLSCGAAITIDLSYVDQQSQAFQRFRDWVDQAVDGNPDYGFSATDAAYMYRITGEAQYATLAVSMVEDQVGAAENAIASHQAPEVAGDSYLYAGDMIGDLAITYDWCSSFLSSDQRTRWANYAGQTVFNIWNPDQAQWGGQPFPWSGWSIDDPANNYFYSFLQATMFWTLADDSAPWMDFLDNVKIPLLTSYFAAIDGGSQEGTGYGLSHKRLFYLYRVWRDSTGIDLANANDHLTDSIAWWIHATVPTLDRTAAIGDQARVSEPVIYDYHRALMLEAHDMTADPAARGIASWWLHSISVQAMQSGFNFREDLLPPGPGGSPPAGLVHHFTATGHLFARSGWDPDAMWLEFDAGPYVQSHAHQDQGSFTLYRDGWLAVTENIWSHSGIQQGTEVHNVLRFEHNGSVVPQVAGTTSTMSVTPGSGGSVHAEADLTPAYDGNPAVSSWQRTIDFSGQSLTVHDSYATGSGTAAVFQIDVPVQPTISGLSARAGDLTVTVLSPATATLSAIDWTTVDSDFNSGWRIDVAGGSGDYLVVLGSAALTSDEIFADGFE
jgi:Heparinase II/III-like protein